MKEKLMKHLIYIPLWFLAFVLLSMACTKTQYVKKYSPEETLPRMIYVQDEVSPLMTGGDLPIGKRMYVEITTKQGVKESGQLIRITEKDLVLRQTFYYAAAKVDPSEVERETTIPKHEIFILKVW